jgi:hypothetical protein
VRANGCNRQLDERVGVLFLQDKNRKKELLWAFAPRLVQ